MPPYFSAQQIVYCHLKISPSFNNRSSRYEFSYVPLPLPPDIAIYSFIHLANKNLSVYFMLGPVLGAGSVLGTG